MNNVLKTALFTSAIFATSALAAPGLTVSGTDLMYNGKKIFFSGTNLAWADYNSDVGDSPLDENAWRKAVEGTRAAGGNAIRWWLFNNMSQSPAIDEGTHLVSGLKASTLSNMKKALDIAEEYGVMVSMCLFSHNLMEPNQWGIYNEKLDITANKNLFTDEGTKAFIDNALIPVLKGVGNHNALMTWEVFNEPEGMTSVGWTTEKLDKATLQKFTNKIAAAIHTADPTLLVSTGSVNIKYQEWWNDANLVAAGGEANGTLDFFQTHYYPYYQDDAVSPFVNTAEQMQATYKYDAKPMIIGEFPASGWSGDTYTASMAAKTQISTVDAYQKAFSGGYAGALAWQYIGDKTEANFGGYSYTIDPALDAMTKLAATAEASIKIKDVSIANAGGDGKMAVTYGADNAQVEYQNKGGWDLSKATTFTWEAKNNGKTEANLYLILKLTDSWTWTETSGSCKVPAGEKVNCSIDISGYTDRNKTLSIIIANYAAGYTGTILYDNIAAGDQVLFNFDEDKYDAFSRSFENTEEMIPEIKIVYSEEYTMGATDTPQSVSSVTTSNIYIVNNCLMVNTRTAGHISVDVFGMNGSHVATLYKGFLGAGSNAFSLADLNPSQYIVRIKGAGITATRTIRIK